METKIWKENVGNKPKLRLYNEFKRDKDREGYLELNMHRKERSILALFRLGIVPIEVEVSQYRQKYLNDRTCPFCKNEVEDQIHFLFNCLMYKHERKTLCLESGQTYVNQNKTLILKFFMEHCPHKLAKYLLNAFMKRTEMLKVL